MSHSDRTSALVTDAVPLEGSTHIGPVRLLPRILNDLGVDVAPLLESLGLRPDIFDDPGNLISYAKFHDLMLECERRTNCDYIGLLVSQNSRLADFGLAGRSAMCSATVGEGLLNFAGHFNLHSSATTVSLVTSGGYSRFIYAISIGGITDARQFQLGAVTAAFNLVRDVCGPQWRPTVLTFATRPPTNLRPLHKYFGAPLHFDSDESAVVFERHWLDRPLPPIEPAIRLEVDAEIRVHQAAIHADFPATVRRVLRKQLIFGESSMDEIAAMFGMHRRTLDRHLQEHGVHYGGLLESVKEDVARQLLTDTRMQVQQVAEALRFSSAANFATAFRRWTGVTPSEFRRSLR